MESGFILFCFSSWKKSGGDRRPRAAAREPWPLGFRGRRHLGPATVEGGIFLRFPPPGLRHHPGSPDSHRESPEPDRFQEPSHGPAAQHEANADVDWVGQEPLGKMTVPWLLRKSSVLRAVGLWRPALPPLVGPRLCISKLISSEMERGLGPQVELVSSGTEPGGSQERGSAGSS